MKNPILKEIRRVTGWHFLIDHEAFPLLLAAMSSTTVLWLYPGIQRIHAAYLPAMYQAAVVHALPQVVVQHDAMIEKSVTIDASAPLLEDPQPM